MKVLLDETGIKRAITRISFEIIERNKKLLISNSVILYLLSNKNY